MGIQDRDYYREHYRQQNAPRRPYQVASTRRVALIWVLLVLALYLFFRFMPELHWPGAPSQAKPQIGGSQTVPEPRHAVPAPVQPFDEPEFVSRQPGQEPIYRCGNLYSAAPCKGGHAVGAPAVNGFDSRPSEKLISLGAEWRAKRAAEEIVTVSTSTSESSGTACQALARQIALIDSLARQPQSAYQQDQLRESKRNIQHQQVALHCQ